MTFLYLDTEVFTGNKDVDLRTVGHAKNARDPETEVMLVLYAVDDEAPQCWDVTQSKAMPEALRQRLDDPETRVVIHNAPYDLAQLQHSMPEPVTIDLAQVIDTSVLARMLGMPPSLGDLGEALGLDEDQQKLKDGKRLIQKFCKYRTVQANNPIKRWTRETAPADWDKFIAYGLNDVVAMREIYQKLPKIQTVFEKTIWMTDQVINERGIYIDIPLIQKALAIVSRLTEAYNQDVYRLTGGYVETLAQRDKLVEWMELQGIMTQGVTKGDIQNLLDRNDLPSIVREVCELRKKSSKTSTAKLKKMMQAVCEDSRVRGTLQYYGASRTGRWAGRLIQIQNFARGTIKPQHIDTAIDSVLYDVTDLMYADPMAALSSILRGTIAAQPGHKLLVTDLSGIEARVLCWLVDDQKSLDIFRNDIDIYIHAASGIFDKPMEQITKDDRAIGKVAILALGYQGGVNAFNNMAAVYQVQLPDEVVEDTVRQWRKANPKIVAFWKHTEQLIKDTLLSGKPGRYGKIEAHTKDGFLYLKLPSGRRLSYCDARVINDKITYKGVDQFTRKWVDIESYGGKFVENITQAVARDILAEALLRSEQQGYPLVAHVHDEIIAEVPDTADYSIADLDAILTTVPTWATDLPLAAKGDEMYRYRKD